MEDPMKPPTPHRRLVVATLAAAALVAAVACKKPASKDAASAETFGAAPVKVFQVRRERITEKITYTGTLEAWTKIHIPPEVREKIQLGYDAAAAQLEQARAGLNLARHALDVSIMRAPIAGVVASKNAEVGDVINPMMGGFGGGAGGGLTLMDYSKVKLVVAISSEDIGRIRKGQGSVLTGG